MFDDKRRGLDDLKFPPGGGGFDSGDTFSSKVEKTVYVAAKHSLWTGKLKDIHVYDVYRNGECIEVTAGKPERAWAWAYWGLGTEEVTPDYMRLKHHDPKLTRLDGGNSYINYSKSSRIPRKKKNYLQVLRGGLK